MKASTKNIKESISPKDYNKILNGLQIIKIVLLKCKSELVFNREIIEKKVKLSITSKKPSFEIDSGNLIKIIKVICICFKINNLTIKII